MENELKYQDWMINKKPQEILEKSMNSAYQMGIRHTLDHINIFIDAINIYPNSHYKERLEYLIEQIKELRTIKD